MAPWVRVIAATSDDLSSNSRAHMLRGEDNVYKLSPGLHRQAVLCTPHFSQHTEQTVNTKEDLSL